MQEKLPTISDYPALVNYTKLNPWTIVDTFQGGQAVINNNSKPIALLGNDLVIEMERRMVKAKELHDGDLPTDGIDDYDDASEAIPPGPKSCSVDGCTFPKR